MSTRSSHPSSPGRYPWRRRAATPLVHVGRRRRLAAALAAAALVATACAPRDDSLPQNALDPEGPIARQLDQLFTPVFWVAVFVFVLVQGLVVYIMVKFRARSDEDAPVQVHGNTRLEVTWTIIPAVILAVIGFFTVATVFDINRRDVDPEVLTVEVIGHQWWWEYRYKGLDVVTANELHIPARRNVNIDLTSADVIHSFWPPKLAGKVDVIPGRVNHMQIEADHPGRYEGQCAEYCGLSHANMRLVVVAHDPDDFDDWVADQRRPALSAEALALVDPVAAEGAKMFSQRPCAGCHTITGLQGANGTTGPDLTHFADRKVFAGAVFETNERNLRQWLRNPPAMKPMNPDDGMGMPDLGLSDEEITKLVAYLSTLR